MHNTLAWKHRCVFRKYQWKKKVICSFSSELLSWYCSFPPTNSHWLSAFVDVLLITKPFLSSKNHRWKLKKKSVKHVYLLLPFFLSNMLAYWTDRFLFRNTFWNTLIKYFSLFVVVFQTIKSRNYLACHISRHEAWRFLRLHSFPMLYLKNGLYWTF